MRKQSIKRIYFVLLVSICLCTLFAALNGPTVSAYSVPSNMQWWADARFGMFIHFGSYSYYGHGEWAFIWENFTKANYQSQVSSHFNPSSYNATTIVNYAKTAGMKYIVITAKHHEGFAMWNSNVASFKDTTGTKEYNIYDFTPFKRDVLGELKSACDSAGIKLGLYYSIWDWNHPSQTAAGGATNMAPDPAKANYVNDMKAQIREIITAYNPAILWFDGDESGWWTVNDGRDLYNYIKGLSPNIIINERVKRGNGIGDFDCPEQTIPGAPLGRSWEECATMNGSWGYDSRNEGNYRSVQSIIQDFVTVVSREGNYLLNIGPKGDGTMTSGQQNILNGIGSWMATYSDSIYGTTRNPFGSDPSWGRYTQKGNKVYAHVFSWPTGGQLQVQKLASNVGRIYLLNNTGTSLGYSVNGSTINISVPTSAPNANDSVVVIEYSTGGATPTPAKTPTPTRTPSSGGNGVTFYQDTGYAGTSKTLASGNYTTAQMTAAGIPDNWVSSVRVPSGYTVEIYDNDNFGGTKWTFTADNSDFVAAGCNDKMSSIKIYTNATGATFYSDINYAGTAKTLAKGNYTMSQLSAAGIPNDSVSSIKVPSGFTVEIYQDDNFGGAKWTFTGDAPNLINNGCNDAMSSVKIY